jgi:hypothetical protein
MYINVWGILRLTWKNVKWVLYIFLIEMADGLERLTKRDTIYPLLKDPPPKSNALLFSNFIFIREFLLFILNFKLWWCVGEN